MVWPLPCPLRGSIPGLIAALMVQGTQRAVQELSRQVGGQSEPLGGDIEDIAYIVLHEVLGRECGWEVRVLELCALRVGDIQCGEKGQTGLPSATSICCARPCVRSWRRTPLSQRSNQRRGGVGLGYLRFSLSLPVWPRSSSQAATSTRGFTNRDRGGATFSTRT